MSSVVQSMKISEGILGEEAIFLILNIVYFSLFMAQNTIFTLAKIKLFRKLNSEIELPVSKS